MASERKIVVTGATGLVGAHVVACLLAQGKKVCAVRRETSDIGYVERIVRYYGIEVAGNLEWVVGDVRDRLAMSEIIKGAAEVYNCASMMSFDKKERDLMWSVNVDGTANVVEVALESNVESFCHLSYVGAIGHTSDGSQIDEMTVYQPDDKRTVYSQSKFRQEMEVWRGIEHGLNAVIVNPGIVVGPYSESEKAIMAGDIASELGIGSMGYVDVRDVAKAMTELVEAKKYGERYILVSENISTTKLKEMYEKEGGVALKRNMSSIGKALKKAIAGNKTLADSVKIAGSRIYVSKKVKEAINIEFTPIEQSIANEVRFRNSK